MQSTLALFRRLYNTLPPLIPEATKQKMAHAVQHLEADPTVSLAEVEDTMIAFGQEVWPWSQAYREFLALAEARVGEHFLLPKLSPALQHKYHEFRLYGGTLRDLHSGRPAEWFTAEERGELCGALVAVQQELREYVNRALVGLEKTRYLRRVNEFTEILKSIRGQLQALNVLAASEQQHPTLASEIRAQVRAFELGLCLLAPEPDHGAVCRSVDFFNSRREHLQRLTTLGVFAPAGN
ncbi:MAG: hypothetical protein HYV42_05160 [Candidatus Magasanikbacteria bacterium]|nr:hypothetical protein [Candidatus Magasanikbacteria bacterium]